MMNLARGVIALWVTVLPVSYASLPPKPSPWILKNALPGISFTEPLDLKFLPQRPQIFFVLERGGKLFSVTPPSQKDLVLDISSRFNSKIRQEDWGAHSLAFHPDFGNPRSTNRNYFYVQYTTKAKEGKAFHWHLSRFEMKAEMKDGALQAHPQSETILMDLDRTDTHLGGALQFGTDGFLYISVGDERLRNVSQTISTELIGGILRIDVDKRGGSISHRAPKKPTNGKTKDYFIPNDNPFVGVPSALEEFWSLGLRNPHRISFDRQTGKLWVGDVGEGRQEEVNIAFRGSNHQWSYKEGTLEFVASYLLGKPPVPLYGVEAPPFLEYAHAVDSNAGAVIGGYVYRGKKLPALYGKYIFGDNIWGDVWSISTSQKSERTRITSLQPNTLVGFAEDTAGELYALAFGRGEPQAGTVLKLERRPAKDGKWLN